MTRIRFKAIITALITGEHNDNEQRAIALGKDIGSSERF